MRAQILAIPLLIALMLSPLAASAATGTITFTSPAAGSTLTSGQSYTISGTITPTPTLPDNVNIQVTLQSTGQVVDVANVAVQSGGAFSYSTVAGSNFATGTYTITATDSSGATGTTTFTFKGASTTPTGTLPPVIDIFVAANSLVYPGQTVQAEVMLVWNTNGTLVTATNTTVVTTLVPPSGSSTTLTASSTSTRGQYMYTYAVPAGSPDGAYLLQVVAIHTTSAGRFVGWGLGQFTVNSQVASTSGLAALTSGLAANITSLRATLTTISNNVNSINTALASITSTLGTVSSNVQGLGTSLTTLSSTVNTISSSIGSISSSITTLTNDVTQLQTTVGTLSGLAGDMSGLQSSVSSLSTSVSNEQTYILVVAALAVITLVLELAILIRKMS